jgi:hypothetical protein
MSTPQFTRTAPVFARNRIQITIDRDNPLDAQLRMIAGDGWNVIDWTDTLDTNEITHKASGLRVYVDPPDWIPVTSGRLPATFDSVIVAGVLGCEEETDSHEAYWTGKKWISVRQDEDGRHLTISNVTHWQPRPSIPQP